MEPSHGSPEAEVQRLAVVSAADNHDLEDRYASLRLLDGTKGDLPCLTQDPRDAGVDRHMMKMHLGSECSAWESASCYSRRKQWLG